MSVDMDPETLDMIRRLFVILDGKDPEAQQTLNEFMRFNNDIERTNLPTRRDVHLISYLDIVGKSYYPNKHDNPFSTFAKSIAVAFMAKGGLKSNQFVDLFRNSPDLAALQTVLGVQEENKSGGIMSRIFGRGKSE